MSNQENPTVSISRNEIEKILQEVEAGKWLHFRNIKNGLTTQIELPPFELANNPTAPGNALWYLGNDYGVDISQKPLKSRALTSEECVEMFGASQSVKMNFIPQMLNSIMLQEATRLVNYCRIRRIGELKKHTRVIKQSVEEYTRQLNESYGSMMFKAYVNYVERFQHECSLDIRLMEMHADTICRNQLPNEKHREVASRTLIINLLIDYIKNYEMENDKVIATKIGQPVHHTPDAYREIIHAMCISISEDFGFGISPDEHMKTWIKTLSNKAWRLADAIIGEESQE